MNVALPLPLTDAEVRKLAGTIWRGQLEGRIDRPGTDARAVERRLQRAMSEAKRALAVEFGRRRGWVIGYSSFCLGQLERGSNQTLGYEHPWQHVRAECDALDHVTHYRANGRPAAIIAQPYGHGETRALSELRQKFLLNAVFDERYPSWYAPGHTRLLVVTPDHERIASLLEEVQRMQTLHIKSTEQRWRDHLQGRRPLYLRGWKLAPGFGSMGLPDPAYERLLGVS